jgi:3D (Asp-Asp-Asp) domain-containing protein
VRRWAAPARDIAHSRYPRWVRVRPRRPLLLVVLALAIPAAHVGTAAAATSPREQAAVLELFATDAALARAQSGAQAAQARLATVRGNLASLATQRALAARLNEIYRAHPLDTLGVLLSARSFTQISDGLDLLDRLSRQDSALVRSARRWHAALEGSSQRLRAAERRAGVAEDAWQGQVAGLGRADHAQRSLLARLRRQHVRSLKLLTATARRAVRRAHMVVRPAPHGGGSTSTPAAPAPAATTTPAAATTATPAVPAGPSLAPGTTLSVAATAYSLPGHTASGLPAGVGVCATDPRVIPLGTRFDVPGYGSCVAADTGSSVVGAKIDIWMPNAQASVYGRQTITITFR